MYLCNASGIRKNWLRRRFKLEGAELAYFDEDGDKKGSVNLFHASAIRKSECPTAKGYEIEIVTPDRTWRFRAPSEDEMNAWLHVLAASVQSAMAMMDGPCHLACMCQCFHLSPVRTVV